MKKMALFLFCLLLCGCQNNMKEEQKETKQSELFQPTITSTVIPTVTPTDVPTATPADVPKESTIPEKENDEKVTEPPKATSTPVPTEPADVTAPVIDGLSDKIIYAGETVSYKKGVSVSDDTDEDVTLEIDTSEVNLDEEGIYTVTYTATDAAGNMTVEEITITVQQIDSKEAEVNRLADELIATLVTDDMSDWDTCYVLWNWCRTQIKYSYSAGDRSSIYAGAYEGLHDRAGDCYAYYATFTVLLQKCSIETIEVRRVGGDSKHWWNLVNLGDGWYHCDSSPRKKGHTYKCFMQTDAQIQEYTNFYKEKPNYYTFDESLYPERETDIVYDGNLN